MITESGFDLSNHYDCPLSVLGLSAKSTIDEIDAAVENELTDLDDNYDDHGVTSPELLEFIEAWVEDVRASA